MVLSLLFQPKKLIQVARLMREANRRGVEIDQLPDYVAASLMRPKKADPARHGLVPDVEVSTSPPRDDRELRAAEAAARAGDWEQAAALVAGTWLDWDRRAVVVHALAGIAAHDDTWLEKWRAARPDDRDLAVVHADALVQLAWLVRGSARASRTTAEQFDGFHRVLVQAEEAARHATRVLPDDPTPWGTLLTLARGLSYDHDAFERLWDELVKRDPHHRAGHEQALQYWCGKWSGSHELMIDFATRAAAKSPTLAGLPLRAAFELELDDAADWKSVRPAIDVLLTLDEMSAADRGWLALALVRTKRYAEAVEQFRALGTNASGMPWRYYGDAAKLFFTEVRAEACQKAKP
ncbi:hypothetical protein Lesp02_32500 [Lentzea sp. NBRC 105346]|uniref:DUF4034 domain-containing protein n=1 Tax=Lentzea sp. NBRC 105346 TaxID=3032205 RepID=UPI0024A2BC41|nr:DUF4034 domain-containing protein [Lentzea sp. NBRC 105346]GLZ31061.1 hypothetical protein Lesp02_32500 [Lentzea sp. NBRC 105346]